jgi:hypothetical protein
MLGIDPPYSMAVLQRNHIAHGAATPTPRPQSGRTKTARGFAPGAAFALGGGIGSAAGLEDADVIGAITEVHELVAVDVGCRPIFLKA